MNLLNYCSQEVSRKLVDAGIILETEIFWKKLPSGIWRLSTTPAVFSEEDGWESVPAPSMAELWRELPENTVLIKVFDKSFAYVKGSMCQNTPNPNPADALAELLICIRRQE